ncbi:unnamed protein product [Prunus armeniaca]|uniref:Uncharacterized protein n=1 Tax=Prunus armeniaca TaxID=36596 RepID=A0A6J5WDR7_PRUAR|nr:unnamed protein product [Prunus armeniaca]
MCVYDKWNFGIKTKIESNQEFHNRIAKKYIDQWNLPTSENSNAQLLSSTQEPGLKNAKLSIEGTGEEKYKPLESPLLQNELHFPTMKNCLSKEYYLDYIFLQSEGN